MVSCMGLNLPPTQKIKGRLRFHHVDGRQGDSAGAPSVLIAYGQNNVDMLNNSDIKGKFIQLR